MLREFVSSPEHRLSDPHKTPFHGLINDKNATKEKPSHNTILSFFVVGTLSLAGFFLCQNYRDADSKVHNSVRVHVKFYLIFLQHFVRMLANFPSRFTSYS